MLTEQIKIILLSIRADNRKLDHGKITPYKEIILDFTKDLDLLDKERIYHYIYDLDYIPLCPICGKPRKFANGNKGYFKTCSSPQCNKKQGEHTKYEKIFNQLSIEDKSFIEEYNIEENYINIKAVYNKEYSFCKICDKLIIGRNRQYCSHECVHKADRTGRAEKAKQTRLDKYGFYAFGLSKEDIENGITNSSQKESVKLKKQESNLESFGHINAFHSIKARENYELIDKASAKQKQIKTLNNKYGVSNPMHYELFVEKCTQNSKTTVMERYGVTNVSYIPEVQDKIKKSARLRYSALRLNSGYTGYIYIFKSENLQLIKIGCSHQNILGRFNSIKRYVSDAELIDYILVDDIFTIEYYLHQKYDSFNKSPKIKMSGYTEWFDISILNDVMLDLNKIKEGKLYE